MPRYYGFLFYEIDSAGCFMMVKQTKNIADVTKYASMWNMDGLILIGFCADEYQSLRDKIRIPFVVYDGFFENDRNIFQEWRRSLRDNKGKFAVDRAIDRLRQGNFGKGHFCCNGVWELVIDYGPGYRVYYSIMGQTLVLLMCAGTKRTQDKDIERAVTYLKRFREAYQL